MELTPDMIERYGLCLGAAIIVGGVLWRQWLACQDRERQEHQRTIKEKEQLLAILQRVQPGGS